MRMVINLIIQIIFGLCKKVVLFICGLFNDDVARLYDVEGIGDR